MERFKTFIAQVDEAKAGETCSCCDNEIDKNGKCGCGPDCDHCGGQHDVSEAYRAPTKAEIEADKRKDNAGKKRPSMNSKSANKAMYKNMMGGLKKEETELDEAAPKINKGKAKGSISATGLRGKGMKKFDVNVAVQNGKFEFRITDETGRFQTVGIKQAAKMLGESTVDDLVNETLSPSEKKLVNQMYDKKGNLTAIGKKVMNHGKKPGDKGYVESNLVDEAVGTSAKHAGKTGMFGGKYTSKDHMIGMKNFTKIRDKKQKQRDAEHAKQDPKMRKMGYAKHMLDTDKADAKARKRGIDPTGKYNKYKKKNGIREELDEATINQLTAEYINENNITMVELEAMSPEQLDEIIGKAIGGAFKIGAKAAVGAGRMAKKAANRMSTSGRANAAEKKADSMEKKNKDRERIKAAQDRLRKAKEASRNK